MRRPGPHRAVMTTHCLYDRAEAQQHNHLRHAHTDTYCTHTHTHTHCTHTKDRERESEREMEKEKETDRVFRSPSVMNSISESHPVIFIFIFTCI